MNVPEGMTAVTTVTATEPDAGQSLTFAIDGGADAHLFQIDPVGGALRFRQAPSYDAPADADGNNVYEVSVRVADGAGGSATQVLSVTVLIGNSPPTLNPIDPVTVPEDSLQQTVSLTGITSGRPTEAQTLTVTAVSSAPALIPNPVVDYTSPTSTATLRFTPAGNAFGTATITVTVSDGVTTFQRHFTVTVTPVNDAPVVSPIGDVTIDEDGSTGSIGFTVGDLETAASDLTVAATSDNPALLSASGITLGGTGINRTITLTPIANQAGTATVTVTVADASGGVTTRTFVLTVRSGIDAPSISDLSDRAISEDGSSGVIGFTVGDADSAAASLIVTATASNTTLFPTGSVVLSGTGADRTITLTPAANRSGSAQVVVTVRDEDGNTATESFTLTVSPANDAPALSGGERLLTSIPRKSTNPAGDPLDSVFSGLVSDLDGDSPLGIAVTELTGTGQGVWQFSLDGGTTWQAFGPVSLSAARLIRLADRVRFLPNPGFIGTPTFTFRAWDGTAGTAGATADLSGPAGTGGTTPFSTGSATATVQVAVTLTSVAEDNLRPAGDTVGALINGRINDADPGALLGIAVTGMTGSANGLWQYSVTGGKKWLSLADVRPGAARLLRATDKVRFVPAANFVGTATLSYRAWDQTLGASGGVFDLAAPGWTGGASAFSAIEDLAFALVNEVNDQPVLDVGGEPALSPVSPGATDPTGNTVAALLGTSVTDADTGAMRGIAVITAASTSGRWQYQLQGGTWQDMGTVSVTSALLLRADDQIRFVPQAGFTGSVTLSYRAWDQTSGAAGAKVRFPATSTAVSTGIETARLFVGVGAAVNHAPVLDTTPAVTLTPIDEDVLTSKGDTVASLLGAALSDGDTGAPSGMALTGLTGSGGTWQYSQNGGKTWKPVGSVAPNSALLLGAADRLRFLSGRDFTGSVGIRYRGWDRTSGTAGGRANLSVPGGTGGRSAFSAEQEDATLVVRPVNDRPVMNLAVMPRLTPIQSGAADPAGDTVASMLGGAVTDPDAGALRGIAVVGTPGLGGRWQYRLGNGFWTDVGPVSTQQALLLGVGDGLRFLPHPTFNGVVKLSYRAWDRTEGAAGIKVPIAARSTAFSTATGIASLTVNAVNDRPVLNTKGVPLLNPVLPNATAPTGTAVSALLGGSVSDPDLNATQGIALTGTFGQGVWQFSTDGGTTWDDVRLVTAKFAILLRSEDLVRFVPAAGTRGKASLSYRAWDQTTGAAGGVADVTLAGATSFSLATETAVLVVNTAPSVQR